MPRQKYWYAITKILKYLVKFWNAKTNIEMPRQILKCHNENIKILSQILKCQDKYWNAKTHIEMPRQILTCLDKYWHAKTKLFTWNNKYIDMP
jgi:hypothetical protein